MSVREFLQEVGITEECLQTMMHKLDPGGQGFAYTTHFDKVLYEENIILQIATARIEKICEEQ